MLLNVLHFLFFGFFFLPQQVSRNKTSQHGPTGQHKSIKLPFKNEYFALFVSYSGLHVTNCMAVYFSLN